jgi:hypothetical protein
VELAFIGFMLNLGRAAPNGNTLILAQPGKRKWRARFWRRNFSSCMREEENILAILKASKQMDFFTLKLC